MPTEVVTLDNSIAYDDAIARAASLIAAGKLVAFPTETVYGVAARADSSEAISTLERVKERPASKPFTLHIGSPDDVHQYVPSISDIGMRVIRRAWPGPLTVVFRVDSPADAPVVNALGQGIVDRLYHEGTIGVRCPDERVSCDLLSRVPHPVVAASANRAGRPPPRDIEGVLAELDGEVELAIDAGTTKYEGPSTVARLNGGEFEILREGVIDARTLDRFKTVNILFVCSGNTCRSPMAEALCRKAIADRLDCAVSDLQDRGIVVHSAGASSFGGGSASDGAVAAARQFGVDLDGHCARSLDQGMIHLADHIFCMTGGHRDAVLSLVPDAGEKTILLDASRDISDPFGGSVDDYRRCALGIQSALEVRVKEMEL